MIRIKETVGHAERMVRCEIHTYKVVVRKHKVGKHLGDSSIVRSNTELHVRGKRREVVDWVHLAEHSITLLSL
jgi:hypothetical protein